MEWVCRIDDPGDGCPSDMTAMVGDSNLRQRCATGDMTRNRTESMTAQAAAKKSSAHETVRGRSVNVQNLLLERMQRTSETFAKIYIYGSGWAHRDMKEA